MDSLEINKIVAGLLVVVLIIIGITNFAEILYHVEQPKVAHYVIEGVDDTDMAEATDEPVAAPVEVPILTLLASANFDKVQKFSENAHLVMSLLKMELIRSVQDYGK